MLQFCWCRRRQLAAAAVSCSWYCCLLVLLPPVLRLLLPLVPLPPVLLRAVAAAAAAVAAIDAAGMGLAAARFFSHPTLPKKNWNEGGMRRKVPVSGQDRPRGRHRTGTRPETVRGSQTIARKATPGGRRQRRSSTKAICADLPPLGATGVPRRGRRSCTRHAQRRSAALWCAVRSQERRSRRQLRAVRLHYGVPFERRSAPKQKAGQRCSAALWCAVQSQTAADNKASSAPFGCTLVYRPAQERHAMAGRAPFGGTLVRRSVARPPQRAMGPLRRPRLTDACRSTEVADLLRLLLSFWLLLSLFLMYLFCCEVEERQQSTNEAAGRTHRRDEARTHSSAPALWQGAVAAAPASRE